jgi:hypothetical protein
LLSGLSFVGWILWVSQKEQQFYCFAPVRCGGPVSRVQSAPFDDFEVLDMIQKKQRKDSAYALRLTEINVQRNKE